MKTESLAHPAMKEYRFTDVNVHRCHSFHSYMYLWGQI